MIHLITGMQGSGKTLFLVKAAYEAHRKGKTIYSNVAFRFPFNMIDYNDVVECNYEDAVVILDEIHQLLPSRRSMSKINISIVDGFLSMVRKKGLDVYGSTQTQRKVDVRFREEADYIYLCEKWAFINNRWVQVPESKDISPSIPIKISVSCCRTFDGFIVGYNFNGNPYFKLYDTKQIIKVRGIKDT